MLVIVVFIEAGKMGCEGVEFELCEVISGIVGVGLCLTARLAAIRDSTLCAVGSCEIALELVGRPVAWPAQMEFNVCLPRAA